MNTTVLKFLIIAIIGSLILLLKSCASISPPQGGDKDTKVPLLLETRPKQNQKNYNLNKITFIFDERIDISKLKENLIINPVLQKDIETETSNNVLYIKFDNAEINKKNGCKTFSINLRDGVKDANEGNIYPSKTLIYTNCQTIDTAKVKGNVLNAYTKDSISNILIALYPYSDTLDIEKSKPTYYTYSSSGKFEIKNIEPNTYKIIAFNDIDKNLTFNSKKENIGFLETEIVITGNTILNNNILVSKNDIYKPALNVVKEDKQIRLVLSEAIYEYAIKSNPKVIHKLSSSRKEIIIYKTEIDTDSIPITLFLVDSSRNDTTYNLKIIRSDTSKLKHVKNIIKTISPDQETVYNDTISVQINFTDPITKLDTANIYLLVDSTRIIKLLNNNFKLNESNNLLSIEYANKIIFKKNIQFIIKSNTIKSYMNDTNSKVVIKYIPEQKNTIKEDPLNYVTLNIKTNSTNYNIELLDPKGITYYKTKNTKKIRLQNLPNGMYSLRAWLDENNNNYWDTGNYKTNTQPEQTFIFKKIMDVKTNWDIEDINIEF